jgi:hypothetical protein
MCRGLNVEGEADSWDFGVGAGFYINATEDKWKNWHMYDYITKVQWTQDGQGSRVSTHSIAPAVCSFPYGLVLPGIAWYRHDLLPALSHVANIHRRGAALYTAT